MVRVNGGIVVRVCSGSVSHETRACLMTKRKARSLHFHIFTHMHRTTRSRGDGRPPRFFPAETRW